MIPFSIAFNLVIHDSHGGENEKDLDIQKKKSARVVGRMVQGRQTQVQGLPEQGSCRPLRTDKIPATQLRRIHKHCLGNHNNHLRFPANIAYLSRNGGVTWFCKPAGMSLSHFNTSTYE